MHFNRRSQIWGHCLVTVHKLTMHITFTALVTVNVNEPVSVTFSPYHVARVPRKCFYVWVLFCTLLCLFSGFCPVSAHESSLFPHYVKVKLLTAF